MKDEIRVHLYSSAGADVSQVLAELEAKPLVDRVMKIDYSSYRLDCVRRKGNLIFFEIVKFRSNNGPGKAGPTSPATGFHFEEDEAFAESTAALLDPESKSLLIQYNHHGPRQKSISDYLSAYSGESVEFRIRYDLETERKFRSHTLMTRFHVGVHESAMSDRDKARGESLSNAIEFASGMGGQVIEITVHASRGGSLTSKARAWVEKLLRISTENSGALTQLEVAGKVDEDSRTEVLDLLAEKLVAIEPVKKGEDLRFTLESRWDALERAFLAWRRDKLICQ